MSSIYQIAMITIPNVEALDTLRFGCLGPFQGMESLLSPKRSYCFL